MKYIILILLTITHITFNLQGMENNKITKYQEHCKRIKKTLKIENKNFFEMINTKKLNIAQELKRINQQFQFYHHQAMKEKNAILLQLKNTHNINDDDWQWCLAIIKEMSHIIKEDINTSLTEGIHQNIISIKEKKILKKYLILNGFDIKKINIQENIYQPNKTISSCSVFIDDEKTPIKIKTHNAEILFSKCINYENKCRSIQTAYQFKNVTTELATAYAIAKKSNKSYTPDTLKQTDEFIFLSKINKKISEIFMSIADHKACKTITKERFLNPIKGNKKYMHFQQLYTIKNLWQKYKVLTPLLYSKKDSSHEY